MRVGVRNLLGTPARMKAQAMQLLDDPDTASPLVRRLGGSRTLTAVPNLFLKSPGGSRRTHFVTLDS